MWVGLVFFTIASSLVYHSGCQPWQLILELQDHNDNTSTYHVRSCYPTENLQLNHVHKLSSRQHLLVVHHSSAPQWSLFSACLYDSVWVHLCPGSSHYPGAAHWSVVCHLQHQVPSSRHSRQSHHWEEVLADLWGSQGVSDPGVSGAVLMCVQTLPLPTARRDSQCAGNDWGHSWEVVRPGGGVYARTKTVLAQHCIPGLWSGTTMNTNHCLWQN